MAKLVVMGKYYLQIERDNMQYLGSFASYLTLCFVFCLHFRKKFSYRNCEVKKKKEEFLWKQITPRPVVNVCGLKNHIWP